MERMWAGDRKQGINKAWPYIRKKFRAAVVCEELKCFQEENEIRNNQRYHPALDTAMVTVFRRNFSTSMPCRDIIKLPRFSLTHCFLLLC